MDWRNALVDSGFKMGAYGAYNCIRELTHLGVCGVNIGIGYHNNHSEDAFASLRNNISLAGNWVKDALVSVRDTLLSWVNSIINLINKIPGIDYIKRVKSLMTCQVAGIEKGQQDSFTVQTELMQGIDAQHLVLAE